MRRHPYFADALRPLSIALLTGLLVAGAAAPGDPQRETGAAEEAAEPAAAEISPAHRAFLEEAALLLSEEERRVFLSLTRGHQRERFIERFWEVRDPYPETPHNELRQEWAARVEMARRQLGGLEGDRARVMLLAGPPQQIRQALCGNLLRAAELWSYTAGEASRREFHVLFVLGPGAGGDRYRFWSPADGLRSLLSWHRPEPFATEGAMRQRVLEECADGRGILEAIDRTVDFPGFENELMPAARGGAEWVQAFAARTTDLPEGAESFAAEVGFAFPGRRQSRTVVQGLISVPLDESGVRPGPESGAYSVMVDGEVLRGDRLFDHFRYRFDMPADQVPDDRLPLVIQRALRPGRYAIVLRLQDRHSGRYFRLEVPLEVPLVEARPTLAAAPPSGAPQAASRTRSVAGPLTGPPTGTPTGPAPLAAGVEAPAAAGGASPAPEEPATALAAIPSPPPAGDDGMRRLGEANRRIDDGDLMIKIQPLPERLMTGKLRVEARTTGEGIAKVAFRLNGRPLLTKTRPPFSVEIDLGRSPRLHSLEAIALDAEGRQVARDKVPINAGPHRFAVRLVEPQEGGRYVDSLSARAEVDLPLNEELDRVEFYLNETLLATLYQPPFVQPILLPHEGKITYVKTVAYLTDGNSSLDIVFINPPPQLDHVRVNFVELYASVIDRKGHPVEGLERDHFVVLEDGIEQSIRRFERVHELPIYAGVVLDTSTSMTEELREAEKAALAFFERVLQPKDRAAVVVFNDQPELKAPLTNNLEILAGGLADLEAEGETALYDSMIYSLFYFSGLRGKRALIVLTDGEDSNSRYSFNEALDFARHTGVAVYAIGLSPPTGKFDIQSKLRRLAHETGGECYFITRASELEDIYRRIEEDLRSQYLLGYQSSQENDEFRLVEVRLTEPGLEAKTIPGYYP